MFCSKCGKTLPFDALECPSCGLTVGDSRFEGSPYTSAQAHILPGDDVHRVMSENYTRTNYTGDPNAADQSDVDARTTYRPTYKGDNMPEDMRRDMRAAVKTSEDEAEETAQMPPINDDVISYEHTEDDPLVMDDLDLSRFRAKPIESAGQSGISADVSEMMQEIESETPRRVRGFGRRRAVYDDYAQEDAPEGKDERAPEGAQDDQPEVFDDIDEEEFDELRHSSFGVKQILKIVVAVVVVAALVVGGVKWVDYICANHSSAPIENVRETLYEEGVALVEAHASTANVEEVLNAYRADSDLTALQTRLTNSAGAVSALTPEDATENELIFMQALQKIEGNITNCIISDAIAVSSNDADAVADSDTRWLVVTNSIAMLKNASSAAELTAIINGEVVDIQQAAEATPTPAPKVNYDTLSKGDKSDEVTKMQTRLAELGYLSETPDGNFGSKTQTAVKIFQQMSGLTVTGIADSDTLNALYADDAPSANANTENGQS